MPRYRLGFLLCDHAIDVLAERHGDYPEMFATAFAEVSDTIDWLVYDVTAGELPSAVDECDGYLISGSRHGAYDCLAWIAPLSDFVRLVATSKRPLVGLCFGHQLIAQALGGTVRKSDKGWGIGIRSYLIAAHADWMGVPVDSITLPVCHQDQVLMLPPAATRLASSAHCENFMVHFAPHVLGIQGHPEFAPAFVGELVEWRREKLPETTYHDARESIAKSHDNRMVKRWIMQFLGIPVLDQ
jgi:GMP synthase-like glutamine amidotransferase